MPEKAVTVVKANSDTVEAVGVFAARVSVGPDAENETFCPPVPAATKPAGEIFGLGTSTVALTVDVPVPEKLATL
jgi:hypothetical protein